MIDYRLIALDKQHEWERYSSDLLVDYRQNLEEGRDVREYEAAVKAVAALPVGVAREELADCLYRAMAEAPALAEYRYAEPNELAAIRAARPARRFAAVPVAKDDALLDKLLGAWYGRVCGCLLGKPVEGMKSADIEALLKRRGEHPLRYYMTNDEKPERAWLNRLQGHMPVDDDTNYVVLAGELIERCGRGFTPEDCGANWLAMQSKNAYCTAERVAFCNLTAGMRPPVSAQYKNPYREWIGAQIRGDYFGYVNPGNPEAAADMAWRDASISHVKNGIYGEMFAAAMIAAAAVTSDMVEVVEAGLGEIPEKSRLYEDVRRMLDMRAQGAEACFAEIHRRWDEYSSHDWCHTNSNAMIVAASLLCGGGDWARSVCLSVETGFDTDCNGATVGSVLGMALGSKGVPEDWKAPICGKLNTSIFGVGMVSLDDMARRTLRHIV